MIIDADSHVEESDAVWSYLDPEFVHRRPTVIRKPDLEGPYAQDCFWLIDGQTYPRPYGNGPSIYGTPVSSRFAQSKGFAIKSQTLEDPILRLADMDRFGINIQVIYPTIFLDLLSADPKFEAALMRSYNTWLAKTCQPYSERLKWAAVVPFRDSVAAVSEVLRTKELGASAVLAYGTAGDNFLHERQFDPIWAEVERLDIPVAMHVGWNIRSLHTKMDSLLMSTTFVALPMMLGLFSMIGGGILDRFPKLRVGFFEAGADWLPYLVPRMERYWEIYTAKGWPSTPKSNPTDWLKNGNVYFTCEGNERFLPQVIEMLGENQVMTSADMPHEEALENSIAEIQERTDIPESLRKKIVTDNPASFYGL